MGLAPYGSPGVNLGEFISLKKRKHIVSTRGSCSNAATALPLSPRGWVPSGYPKAKSTTVSRTMPLPCKTPERMPCWHWVKRCDRETRLPQCASRRGCGADYLFFLPSLFEPFGLACQNEAMLCGFPRCGEVPIRCGAGTIWLAQTKMAGYISCGRCGILIMILRQVLPDREKMARMGAAARRRMESWSPREYN